MGIISVIVTILIFGLIVVFHEFGHFIIAKKNGILVEEFAIGMGPLIYGKQKGDTFYSVRALPVGGYCRMLGESEDMEDERAFTSKTVLQRMAVCVAGVVMNMILAYLIVIIILSSLGFTSNTVGFVGEGTPAEVAGIQTGDKILKYNNQNIHDFNYLNFAISKSGASESTMIIEREGQKYSVSIQPVMMEDAYGQSLKIGLSGQYRVGLFNNNLNETDYERAGVGETLYAAFWRANYYVKAVLNGLIELITFQVSVDDLSGPVGVGQVVNTSINESIEYGIWYTILNMLNLAALLSANLAVFNLLPLPALDGGRLVFLIIEGIRRKPVSPEKEGMVHFIGLMLLLALSLLVTFKDILKLF